MSKKHTRDCSKEESKSSTLKRHFHWNKVTLAGDPFQILNKRWSVWRSNWSSFDASWNARSKICYTRDRGWRKVTLKKRTHLTSHLVWALQYPQRGWTHWSKRRPRRRDSSIVYMWSTGRDSGKRADQMTMNCSISTRSWWRGRQFWKSKSTIRRRKTRR